MSVTMIGIDPHKATHLAVAIDAGEEVIDRLEVSAGRGQVVELARWADQFERRAWAVESAGGLGLRLAQQLVAAGELVFDVAPALASRVRVLGTGGSSKNDCADARSVAIAAQRSPSPQLVSAEPEGLVLRLLAKRHRDLSRSRVVSCNRLHALLLALEPGGIGTSITVPKAQRLLEQLSADTAVDAHRVLICEEMIGDIDRLDTALKASNKRIVSAVKACGTTVNQVVGIGPICAAIIVGYTGNIERFPTKGHFASYNGTAPIEASSGPRRRHRLNTGGSRQLNYAIHVAAVTQIGRCGEGRAFYDRKIAEGKSPKDALRALKRRISDRVYKHLKTDAAR